MLTQSNSNTHIVCHEALPDIDIAVQSDPRPVIDAIASFAERDVSLIVERHDVSFAGTDWYFVNIRSLRSSPHEKCGGQLIARSDRPGRIVIEMRAARWHPDPPTREAYVSAARELFRPLLRVYNRAHACSYRLRIARPPKLGIHVSPTTRMLIDQFAILANQTSLHTLDWNRFYRIVKESRREAPAGNVRALLIEHGFGLERATELAELYEHLWAYKNLR